MTPSKIVLVVALAALALAVLIWSQPECRSARDPMRMAGCPDH